MAHSLIQPAELPLLRKAVLKLLPRFAEGAFEQDERQVPERYLLLAGQRRPIRLRCLPLPAGEGKASCLAMDFMAETRASLGALVTVYPILNVRLPISAVLLSLGRRETIIETYAPGCSKPISRLYRPAEAHSPQLLDCCLDNGLWAAQAQEAASEPGV